PPEMRQVPLQRLDRRAVGRGKRFDARLVLSPSTLVAEVADDLLDERRHHLSPSWSCSSRSPRKGGLLPKDGGLTQRQGQARSRPRRPGTTDDIGAGPNHDSKADRHPPRIWLISRDGHDLCSVSVGEGCLAMTQPRGRVLTDARAASTLEEGSPWPSCSML